MSLGITYEERGTISFLFFFKGTVRSLCIILLFSYGDLGCTLHHACPLLFLFFLCSCLTAFHSFCFDAHFWSCFFCVFLACLLLFFSLSLSLVFFFSLSSSACLPALALTGGYSSLGWAETASLYNTDRLLCNQIPSVATSEDSLSRFLLRAHTHKLASRHMHTHTTSVLPTLEHCVCTCVCMCARMVYVQ